VEVLVRLAAMFGRAAGPLDSEIKMTSQLKDNIGVSRANESRSFIHLD
jgi:hypothetical protein